MILTPDYKPSMAMVPMMMHTANNGARDVSTNYNSLEVPSDPNPSSIIVTGNVLFLNRTHLLHYRRLNCVRFGLGCEPKHQSQSNEKEKINFIMSPPKATCLY